MKKAVTCAQCGTKMRAGIKSCTKCGYRLRDPEAEALAEAAQAQEAAANLLTEEEVAAIRAAELASETEEIATTTSSVGGEEGLSLPERRDADTVAQEKRAVLATKEATLAKQSAKAEIDALKFDAKTAVTIAKVESDIESRNQESEATTRADAVRLEMMETDAKAKAAKTASLTAAKLSKMRIAENAKAAKLRADEEKRALSAEAEISRMQVAEEGKSAKRITDAEKKRLDAEAKAAKRASKEAKKLAKMQVSESKKAAKRLATQEKSNFSENAALDARDATRDTRAAKRAIASRAFDSRVADFRQDREHALAKKREKEILRAERVAFAGKEEDLRTETRDARAIAKGLRTEEKKEAKYRRAEAEVQVLEKRAENRLYQKRVESDKRVRKRRETDMQRVAAKQAAIRERETKRLGAIQYKAAAASMTADAAEAHRLANQAECDMQKRMHEDKIAANEVKAEKKIIRLRAGDLQKHSRTKIALREKETRALGRAELRALRVVKTEEALEAHRRADEVMLETDEKQRDAKRYQKKLAADRKLVRTRAADADKLQREEIAVQEKLHEAKTLEASRASRIRTDDSERAVLAQKNQTKLYSERRTAADKLAEREHKLEMRSLKLSAARDDRVMTMKEKEQHQNAKLAARYEKEAIKRAKKISKISGAPVSLVPALSGEAPSHALLTSVDTADSTPVPTLRDPDSLLARSYESNQEQYRAYKKARKKKESRLRYVEIGVRNDKKYFDTLYEGGEVMVAKRTVYIARAQAVIAILLMLVALVGSILPVFTLNAGVEVPVFSDAILDNQDKISFESLLMDKPLATEGTVEYLKAFIAKCTGPDGVSSITAGLGAFAGVASPLTAAFSGNVKGLGAFIVLLLLAVGMILTPIVILINILVALFRVIFRMGGKSVAITRVMRNLRASYAMLGFYILPLLLSVAKPTMGFFLYVGSFGAAILLNVILNLVKKYEKGDRAYARWSRISGIVRLALLVGFLFLMLNVSKIFNVSTIGAEGKFTVLLTAVFLLCSYIFTVFCSRAITTFGFEIIGYTKAQPNKHAVLIVFGALAGALGGAAGFIGALSDAPNAIMCFAAAGVMAGLILVTAIFGLIKLIIEKRHSMLEPIIHALGEGYPLK